MIFLGVDVVPESPRSADEFLPAEMFDFQNMPIQILEDICVSEGKNLLNIIMIFVRIFGIKL